MTERVSVIVPTFNRAYCLPRAIESVLSQTYRKIELVVADDGSSDDTAEVVRRFAARDPRVVYVHQDNRGASAARNLGIRSATGEFIVFLDSDDVAKPWLLDAEVACMRRLPQVGLIWTNFETACPDGRLLSPRALRTLYGAYRYFSDAELFAETYRLDTLAPGVEAELGGESVYVGDVFSQMLMGNLVPTSAAMLRRSRLEAVKGFDETLQGSGEDYDFHLRSCREGPVALIDAPGFIYHIGRDDQLTHPVYEVDMAGNFLRTVERTIAAERDRILLPRHMIRATRSYGERWLGESLIAAGRTGEARKHLARSLFIRPTQWRTALMLLSTLLPDRMRRAALTAYQAIKHTLPRAQRE